MDHFHVNIILKINFSQIQATSKYVLTMKTPYRKFEKMEMLPIKENILPFLSQFFSFQDSEDSRELKFIMA